MLKNEVGRMICHGMSIQEIQKRVKDFPDKPTVDYFVSLGYTRSTARTYITRLVKREQELQRIKTKNQMKQKKEKAEKRDFEQKSFSKASKFDDKKSNFDNKPVFSKKVEKKQTEMQSIKKSKESDSNIIYSKNADFNNILLDTCVLESKEGISIIEKSEKVQVLIFTIDEFDSIVQKSRRGDKFSKFFISNINKYSKKFVEDDKFIIPPFELNGTSYVDKKLIEFCLSKRIGVRPTIITCDIRLAARAKCYGIEYILCSIQNNEVSENNISDFKRINEYKCDIKIFQDRIHANYIPDDVRVFCFKGNELYFLNVNEDYTGGLSNLILISKKGPNYRFTNVHIDEKLTFERYLYKDLNQAVKNEFAFLKSNFRKLSSYF